MYLDIYDIISNRLAEVGIANVDSGLGEQPPLPAVQPYLVEDKPGSIQDPVSRVLHYGLKVSGTQIIEMMTMLATIRTAFDDYDLPDCIGVKNSCSVAAVRLEDISERGTIVYSVLLVVEAFPETFSRT